MTKAGGYHERKETLIRPKNEMIRFGKSIELFVAALFLKGGYDVYALFADDQGVDYVVKNHADNFVEIQIKASQGRGQFIVQDVHPEAKNYLYIFYVESLKRFWVLPSSAFVNLSSVNVNGKNAGKRTIHLC